VKDLLSSPTALLLLIGLVFVMSAVALFYFLRNRSNSYATPLERATFGTLHTVALASPSLREGLSPSSASFALPYLRQLLDTCALTMTDKIDFFIRCRLGGGFIARSYTPGQFASVKEIAQ
jgi:two-component system LytT family sensor kinase